MTDALVKQLNETVNINNFPELDQNNSVKDGVHLIMGDLHANGLKLLYMLIRHGVLKNISKEDYEFFAKEVYPSYADPQKTALLIGGIWKLKNNRKELTSENMKRFETMIQNAHINNQPGFVIKLIGDEIGDRGFNDYYVLKILEKLSENKVMFDIAISNHSIDPINAYENGNLIMTNPPLGEQAGSIVELGILIDSPKFSDIDKAKINAIFANTYMPNLKMFSYSLSKDGTEITFQSHAPVNLAPIKKIAEKFKIAYKDGSAKELAQTLDKLNEHFQSEYVKKNKIHELFPGNENADMNSPFFEITWNTQYKDRPSQLDNGDKINFVHGHVSTVYFQSKNNIYNTDNILGKAIPYKNYYTDNILEKPFQYHEAIYNIVVAHGQLMPNVKLENENVAPLAQKTTKNTKLEEEFIKKSNPLVFSATSAPQPFSIASVDPVKQFLDSVKNKEKLTGKGAFKVLDALYVKEKFNFVGENPKLGFSVGVSNFNNSFYIQDPNISVQLLPTGEINYVNRKNNNTPATPNEVAQSSLVQNIHKAITQSPPEEKKNITMTDTKLEEEFIKKSNPLAFSATSAPQPFSIASVDPVKQFLDSVKNKEKLTRKGAFKILDAQYVKEAFNFVGENPEFGFAVGVSNFNNSFYIQDPNISVQLLPTGEIHYVNRKDGNIPATPSEVAQSSLVQNIHKAITQSPPEEKKNITKNPKLSM